MENKNSKNNQIRQSKINNSNTTPKNSLETNQNTKPMNNKDLVKNSNAQTQNKTTTNVNKPKTQNKNNKKYIISACTIFGLTFLAAILSKLLGGKMVEGRINPPAYPPEWFFSVAWGILYILIALATFLDYKNKHNSEKRNNSMTWYGVHLFFNLFWPLFYFRLDSLIVSCFILLAMVITAIVITFKYFRNNLVSGWLFTIYTLWLLYAMYLNLAITLLNV